MVFFIGRIIQKKHSESYRNGENAIRTLLVPPQSLVRFLMLFAPLTTYKTEAQSF